MRKDDAEDVPHCRRAASIARDDERASRDERRLLNRFADRSQLRSLGQKRSDEACPNGQGARNSTRVISTSQQYADLVGRHLRYDPADVRARLTDQDGDRGR
jgi:hypothetical protein